MTTRGYFTTEQRQLVIECAMYHVDAFIARRKLTPWSHQQEQARIRAQFRQSWQAALAAMRRDAKPRRRA
ncbi:MAG: hypothetical protein M3Z96_09050 [Pseudomonadota bacterium]|nr:hypothetical protein [Pseudomonadota bacterium]